MAATVQAKRVADALKSVGLKHGDWRRGGEFTVTTDKRRIRDKQTGRRYSEFGDAMAHLHSRAARAKAAEHADALVRAGCSVTILTDADGRIITTIVSSTYNPRREVTTCENGENGARWISRRVEDAS